MTRRTVIAAAVILGIATTAAMMLERGSKTNGMAGPAARTCGLDESEGQEASSYPILLNPNETRSAISKGVPLSMRIRRTRATARVSMLIDTAGKVESARITAYDGPAAFAEAFLASTAVMRFEPAYLGRSPVCIWIEVPLTYPLTR